MALLSFPCHHRHPHRRSGIGFRPTSPCSPVRLPCPLSKKMPASLQGVRATATEEKEGTAVVWFKQDLRTDDHPGLVAAASRHRMVVPLYVFDPRILSRLSEEKLELLLFALEDLRNSLRDQGSDLIIGFGSADDIIVELVDKTKATHIFTEEEIESDLRKVVNIVEESLSALSFSWQKPKFVCWRTQLYDIESLEELPSSYNVFQKLQFALTSPLESPSLPLLDIELERGALPNFDDVRKYLSGNPCELDEDWISIKRISAKTMLRKEHIKLPTNLNENLNQPYLEENNKSSLPSNNTLKGLNNNKKSTFFVSRKGNVVGGGTSVVLDALAAYLRYLEGTARDDWQEMHEKQRMVESRRGASFGALFGCALSLGTISRRRVHYEAIKYEKERNAGFLSPFGYSVVTVAAAVDTVRSMEWYWLLALKSQRSNEGIYAIRTWRWNAYLIQYTVVGNEGLAVLLVHGFGAFLEHYRSNISAIADNGHRVWAITLLGFGKSEKPNIVYTELIWAELLRDFIVDVVGEPVHLVGNSIGGYFVAVIAGLWPKLAKSAVLINAAGSVIPGYSSAQSSEAVQTPGFAWLGTRLLLVYLRLRVANILKSFYPTKTKRADDWLVREMIRASFDPGVLIVLESIFTMNLSVPLNYLLGSFLDKVLIIQGIRDPLSKSELRLSMLKDYCKGITIRELDAGHCPHDEQPELVNSIICEWTMKCEHKLLLEST